MSRDRGPARTVTLADLSLVLLAIGLIGLTVAVVSFGSLSPAVVNDRFDIVITTVSTLIAGAVAALARARGHVTHEPAEHLRASAFTVLAVVNLATLIGGVIGADRALGAALDAPGQLPPVAGLVSRATASMLLVAAGWAAISRRVPAVDPTVLLIVPTAIVMTLLAAAVVSPAAIPPLLPAGALDALRSDPTAPMRLGEAPLFLGMHTLVALAFLAASSMEYRAYLRSRRPSDALLSAGLLMAAFSQVHSAIHPGSYAGLVTTADLLRLAFYGLLLIGVVADSRRDVADLRAATVEVRRLAASQFAAAGLEERARLAREIHDGLAQDLWYAKLKQSRLAQVGQFSGEAAQLSGEVATAIDNALAEARNAVAAMRQGAESGPLLEMLQRVVDDFGDRFAVRAALTVEGAPPEIGPRAQAEVLRIVQEALTNVRKHADATVVRVNVESDGHLRLTIADNGRGFRPGTEASGFGLESMRQRAEIIGAELDVESEPQGGTRVQLVMRNQRKEGSR